MSLHPLIKNQTIKIDDHKWGCQEMKIWDDKKIDVHIDKSTNRGKWQGIRIKIPINSDRDISISSYNSGEINEIPRNLIREIRTAFENKNVRNAFIGDLYDTLLNYESILNNANRIKEVLLRLSKHFDLNWNGEEIITYLRDSISVMLLYNDSNEINERNKYYTIMDENKIEIGQNNGRGTRYFE